MTTLDAYTICFRASAPDRVPAEMQQDFMQFMPPGFTLHAAAHAVFYTALARLTGQLPSCRTTDDFVAALRHFFAHLRGVVFNDDDVTAECRQVVRELEQNGIPSCV